MNKLLSIVIPVYNMEKYVIQTLDSLVCSRMEDLQIIIVNDGSTDRSGEIIREWALCHPDSVEIIDKVNGGHGSAWNVGVSNAFGEYLAFLDSDDWVCGIDKLLAKLETAKADLLFTDCLTFHEENGNTTRENIKKISSGLHDLGKEGLPLKANSSMMCNFHYCIYKTEVMKRLSPLFHEKTSYDDIILSVAPLAEASSFEYLGLPFYVYRLGRGDQSMAPAVISKKIGQQERERKYAIEYALSHPSYLSNDKKHETVNIVIHSICTTFYNFIMKLTPECRKAYLDSWTDYVAHIVPEPAAIFEYSAYRALPWPLYRFALKAFHLLKRIV